jgi:hypothetical protein
MKVNDMESTFDRIEEGYPHHLDCIHQPHLYDIHDTSQSHEARHIQSKAGRPVKRHRHNDIVSKKEQWDVDDTSENNSKKVDQFLRGYIYHNTLCEIISWL